MGAVIFLILMAALGALCSICFAGYRGITIYHERFDSDGKPKKPKEEEAEGSSGEKPFDAS